MRIFKDKNIEPQTGCLQETIWLCLGDFNYIVPNSLLLAQRKGSFLCAIVLCAGLQSLKPKSI